MAAGLIGALLYFAHAAFVPIVLAFLFSLILSSPTEALHRRGVPRSLAATLVLLALLALAGTALDLLWTPAQKWWTAAPQTIATIESKIRPLFTLMSRFESLSEHPAQSMGSPSQPVPKPATANSPAGGPAAATPLPPVSDVAMGVLGATSSALISTLTVIIVTLFAPAGGPPTLAALGAVLARDHEPSATLSVMDAVRRELGRYYLSIAVINLGLGTATAVAATLLGMPNPVLWGAVAAVLNFLPYAGPAITLLLLTLVAFVTFDSLGHVAAVAASFLALSTLEGQVVQPLVVGRRLALNPLIVFLALWFWGWFWGVAGIVIAVPSLIALKIIAEQSKTRRSD